MPKGKKKIVKKKIEKCKRIDRVKGLNEIQAWNEIGKDLLNPTVMFRRAAGATGTFHSQAIAVLSVISTTFMTELNKEGAFFLPGFGTFHKQFTPSKEGKMMNVFGKMKAVPPVQAKTEIIFVPFDTVLDVVERDSMPCPPPVYSGGTAPSGSRAPVTPVIGPAAAHAPAPEVIPAPDASDGDDKDDVSSSPSLIQGLDSDE